MAAAPERLSSKARSVCESEDLVFSVASCWEIGIKYKAGKLPLPTAATSYIPRMVRESGAVLLPILLRHSLTAAELPMLHRDPFDRMLVAQCMEEKLAIVAADEALDGYGIERIW